MNPKHIEMQVEANYREGKQLQQQIAQMVAGNPQRQQLVNRLEMIIRAQKYWQKEYFNLTGRQLSITPLQTNPVPNLPPKLIETEAEKANLKRERELFEWRATRENIRNSMIGNPHSVRVEIYLNSLERTYGDNVPKLPKAVVFGKAKVTNSHINAHNAQTQEYFGTELKENSSILFEDKGSVIIFENGAVAKSDNRTLILIKDSKKIEQNFSGEVNVNSEELKKMLREIRGN